MAAAQSGAALAQGQVTISRNGRERNLSVRVTSEQSAESDHGYVITLDDITELVTAQRTSAWADVARRIAHEIKNPLTPIQLSAERLRRKYGKVITEDSGVFEQCTDTIVRQVDDIRRMVDEFSRFARMPKPVIAAEDVADTVRQAVFLMRVGNADIDIEVEIAEDPMPARFDRRLISQALTNIIKNATEAIAAVPPAELGRGRIQVFAAREGDDIVIDVVDNGIGLPKENRNRLLEPYVTTREKGTGLGLAIVGRILEEHGGGIELRDAADKIPGQRGAWVRAAICRRTASAEPRRTRTTRSCERVVAMAADILIVDDEADIRELVAGILQDEGYSDAHRAQQRRGARARSRRAGRTWCSSTSGCRAAGSTACSCSTSIKQRASRPAGGDDLRPRQYRDRGRRDQAGRLRLHREAVQGRPAGAGRRARAGDLAAQARGQGAQAAGAAAVDAGRPLAVDQPVAPDRSRRSRRPTAAS